MSRKGLTLKETCRRERIAAKQAKRDAAELAKRMKLAIKTALEPPRPRTPIQERNNWGAWHNVSRPRVNAVLFFTKMLGYHMIHHSRPVILKRDGKEITFDTMQGAAAHVLAEYKERETNAA